MKVHNYMENAVDLLLKDLLKKYEDMCKCDMCINDIKAIALNKLKPHYVSTKKGNLYTKVDEMNLQFDIDIYKALIEAIEIVRENPRHE
ncbi:MAG: late competence development ComFB family protein [Bacillota bacterium]|nr:late competence development ComFB family protein [Bacillota bacterium]